MNARQNAIRFLAIGLLAAGIGNSVFGAVTAFKTIGVDNSAGGAALDGFVTTDLLIDFAGQYTISELLLELSPGDIYQHDFVSSPQPPNGALIGFDSALAFDTFIAQGSAVSGGPFGDPSVIGGAVDFGAPAAAAFDDQTINIAYGPPGGVVIQNQTDFLIARLSLKNTVNAPVGAVKVLAAAALDLAVTELGIFDGCVGESFFACGAVDPLPVVGNLFLLTVQLNEKVGGTVASSGGAVEFLTFDDVENPFYTPGFGANANYTNLVFDFLPTLTNDGMFMWNTTGARAGSYVWGITGTNQFGSDTGQITVEVYIPEPASGVLAAVAVMGVIGCRWLYSQARRSGTNCQMRWPAALAVMLFVVGLSVSARAGSPADEISQFSTMVIDNSAGGGALDGFVTTDLKIDFIGQFKFFEMWIQLDTGSVYQDLLGGNLPPTEAVVGMFPSLAFDTFLALGSDRAGGPFGDPSIAGGPLEVGGPPNPVFSPTEIAVAWTASAGNSIFDQSGFLVSRISLSDDANGTAAFIGAVGNSSQRYDRPIRNGVFVPEPGTAVLFGVAMISMLFGRRRGCGTRIVEFPGC